MSTEVFLQCLSSNAMTKGVPERIRLIARSLLRHYPSPIDVKVMANSSKLLCADTAEAFNREHYEKSFSEEQA